MEIIYILCNNIISSNYFIVFCVPSTFYLLIPGSLPLPLLILHVFTCPNLTSSSPNIA